MIRITQLKLSINHTPEELAHKIRKALRLKNEGCARALRRKLPSPSATSI